MLAIAGSASAAVPEGGGSDSGVICIAPFHVDARPEPIMSETTWPPGSDSKFTFRVDKHLTTTVAYHEMGVIRGVPTNRKVLVEVKLDGRPFESFRLDLRKERDQRVCLWLYPGYWHWTKQWGEEKGCRCKAGVTGK